MPRGLHAIVALTLALTACGDVGGVVSPSPVATTSVPPVNDVVFVRQALAATRGAATATFVAEATFELTEGTVTVRREGAYDLDVARSSYSQTVTSDPPELLRELDADLAALRKTHRTVTADGRATLPPMLRMLEKARYSPKDGSFRLRVPPYANVLVPAEDAFLAFPSDLVADLIARGADPERMSGNVDVIVEVDHGAVVTVFYDIGELVDLAYSQIGRGGAGARFSRFAATLYVNEQGEPVT